MSVFSKEAIDHPRKNEMILKSLDAFGMGQFNEINKVPTRLRLFYATLPYYVVVRSLVLHDKRTKALSNTVLARKYGLTYGQVRYIFDSLK